MQVANILYIHIKPAWCSDMINAWRVARAKLHVIDSVEIAVMVVAPGWTPSACLVASVGYVAAKMHHDLQTDATDFIACPSMQSRFGEDY